MRLRGLQHVSSPFPQGKEAAIKNFYGELLGLRELALPPTLAHLDLIWFSAGSGLELHFYAGPVPQGSRRHFCLNIDDLNETRRVLADAGSEPFDDNPIPGRPRFFCHDPAGNLIEFTSIESHSREIV